MVFYFGVFLGLDLFFIIGFVAKISKFWDEMLENVFMKFFSAGK